MSERVWSTSTRVVLFAATGRHVGHMPLPLAVAVTELSHRVTGIMMIVIIMIITYDDAQRSNIPTSGSLRGFKLYHCHLSFSDT